MFFAYIDESNPEPDTASDVAGRFLVVSSVIVDAEAAHDLSQKIEDVRTKHGFLHTDRLKFSVGDKPPQISSQAFVQAKREVLEAAIAAKVRVILYCALHKIIDANGMDTYLNWAIDAQLTKLQQFYNEEGHDRGFVCFIDRHSRSGQSAHLRNKFQERNHQSMPGFNTPDLLAVCQVWDGTSHLCSLCDIICGSYSLIVNSPEKDKVGRELIKLIAPLVWGVKQADGSKRVRGRGLLFRPEEPWALYKPYYDEAYNRIVEWANS